MSHQELGETKKKKKNKVAPAGEKGQIQTKLDLVKYVVLEQHADWRELMNYCFPCCEKSNRYDLYEADEDLDYEDFDYIGNFQEESSCCWRCMCMCRRKFEGELIIKGVQVSNSEVPYKCHCIPSLISCPCMKPEMQIFKGSHLIGHIEMPYFFLCCTKNQYNCSQMEMHLFDNKNILKYIISSTCCQKGMWCPTFRCCGTCKYIEFDIKDQDEKPVGMIKNIYNKCYLETCTKSDKIGIIFPDQKINSNKRIMILQAAIWLDYLRYQA